MYSLYILIGKLNFKKLILIKFKIIFISSIFSVFEGINELVVLDNV